MSYFRKRKSLGDDTSPCDSDPFDPVCVELAKKPPSGAAATQPTLTSWFNETITKGMAAITGDASGAANVSTVGQPGGNTAGSVTGLPVVPLAVGLGALGALWFIFGRKGK